MCAMAWKCWWMKNKEDELRLVLFAALLQKLVCADCCGEFGQAFGEDRLQIHQCGAEALNAFL